VPRDDLVMDVHVLLTNPVLHGRPNRDDDENAASAGAASKKIIDALLAMSIILLVFTYWYVFLDGSD
jgi:hypothetical protein